MKKIQIKLTDYMTTCGYGCCTNFGTITEVNGVELECHNQDVGTIVTQILEHLGYEVELTELYDS